MTLLIHSQTSTVAPLEWIFMFFLWNTFNNLYHHSFEVIKMHKYFYVSWRKVIASRHKGYLIPICNLWPNSSLRLMAPSHDLNHRWLIISGVVWHLPKSNCTGNAHDILKMNLKITNLNLQPHLLVGAFESIHLPLMPHIHISELGEHWFR